MEIGLYSCGKLEGDVPLGIGVTFAVRQHTGKLPERIKFLKITASFGAKALLMPLKKRQRCRVGENYRVL